MNYKDFGRHFETICAINITPFHPDTLQIHWDALADNVRFLIDHGVNVIVPCGNTGEFYGLTLEEAKAVTKRVVEIVEHRAIVVAGIGYSVATAIELGSYAQEVGADCVLIHQPHHPYITNDGAVSYYKKIIDALDIPSVIYFKDPNLSDDVLFQLATLEKLIAVKYAINDLPRFAQIVRDVPKEHSITWICGTAEKWAPFYWSAGARGFTSGLINVAPEKSFAMLNALKAGDEEASWRVWQEILPFENLRAKHNNGNNVVVVKEAIEQMGLQAGPTREPCAPLNEGDRVALSMILDNWKIAQS